MVLLLSLLLLIIIIILSLFLSQSVGHWCHVHRLLLLSFPSPLHRPILLVMSSRLSLHQSLGLITIEDILTSIYLSHGW